MTRWQAILTAALIGAERAVVPPPPTLLPASTSSPDQAATLLDHAALLTVARRAGLRADSAQSPRPAADDTRPTVSAAAGRRLARILAGENSDLIAEWLTAAVTLGLRPPPQLLPALLDRARRVAASNPDPDEARLRDLVAAAGGPRASWLAGLNPAWSWLLTERAPGPAQVRLTEAGAAQAIAFLDEEADGSALGALVTQVPGPWPEPLLRRVLTLAAGGLARTPLNASRVVRLAGVRADPALGAPGAMADFPPQAPQVLHNMLAVLRFRYEMLRELDAR
jgi:Family of unknown function (DUF5691)